VTGTDWASDGYHFSAEDILRKPEKYLSLCSILEADEFPYRKSCIKLILCVRKYLEALKIKQDKTDNSFFDLLKL